MARINNVRKRNLNYLIKGYHYNVVNVHTLEPITVSKPLPYDTGNISTGFPAYLYGFENYYNKGCSGWHLKQEYRKNRPQYTIEVTHVVYDIVLTWCGEEIAQERFKKYQRLAQTYRIFLNK